MLTHDKLMNDVKNYQGAQEQAAFWWLGQIGYLLRMGETLICIDHFFSDHPERMRPPLLDAQELEGCHLVMGTHNHMDHVDVDAWKILAQRNEQTMFVVPRAVMGDIASQTGIDLQRFIGVNDGETVHAFGVDITGVAAAHEFLDMDEETGLYPYMGYLIEGSGVRIYHAGDTCVYDGLAGKISSRGPVDIMFLPINGRDGAKYRVHCIGNMTYQEAVDLTGTVAPALAVPAHYEMFANNLANPFDYTDYLEAKYPEREFWVGGHGVRVIYEKKGC